MAVEPRRRSQHSTGSRNSTRSPDGERPEERALREGYLHFLPRLAKAYLLALRAAAATLGWDFDEDEWEAFAREHDLPVASTFARASGGGSFAFAKFLARVGPLPPHPGGPRFRGTPRVRGWTRERLLLGAMTVARMNRGWPSRDGFDDVARKARARGIEVPLVRALERGLGLAYGQLKRAASEFVGGIRAASPGSGVAPTYARADGVARGMALGVELLGYRPSSEEWDSETRPLRARGVPVMSTIARTFGGWHVAWAYVEKLGLDPGQQRDPRPRYDGREGIARGMALAEDRLGYRPSSKRWTDAVRELKREVGPGVIPAKPTIYAYFSSWDEAWLYVDLLRASGAIAGALQP